MYDDEDHDNVHETDTNVVDGTYEKANNNGRNIFIFGLGVIGIAVTSFVTINYHRAVKRLELKHVENMQKYPLLLKETTLKLLDETLSEIERKRLEKSKKHLEKKMQSME
jgi:hypothetical protein